LSIADRTFIVAFLGPGRLVSALGAYYYNRVVYITNYIVILSLNT
jgi:hypothetical protein